MIINFDIKKSLIHIILSNKLFFNTFSKKHSNSKYSLDIIIDDIIYVLKTGISWRHLRSSVNWHTVYRYYSLFVKYNIFLRLFRSFQKKYLHFIILFFLCAPSGDPACATALFRYHPLPQLARHHQSASSL